jgi:hypothetical protein
VAISKMQTLILWSLLVRTEGGGPQKDIKPEVKKSDREALVRAGLIVAPKQGRGYWLEVTDKGWSWAAEHLDADLPERSIAANAILQAWLARLKAFMANRDIALADVLRAQQPVDRPTTASAPTIADYDALRTRIRRAYLEIGGALNTRVFLSDLRERLRDVDRALLDDALCRMHLEEGATLSGLNNPQEITQPIRNGAVVFKGEPMYVLWITK